MQAAVSGTESIPIVGTSITDYATALEIDLKDWTGKTGINATGTSDLAPLDKQAEMFKELLPNAKRSAYSIARAKRIQNIRRLKSQNILKN